MSPCPHPGSSSTRRPHQAVNGVRCVGVHLFVGERRAVVTYMTGRRRRGRGLLDRVLVCHAAFEALLALLPQGTEAVTAWLNEELRRPGASVPPRRIGDVQSAAARDIVPRLIPDEGPHAIGKPRPANCVQVEPRIAAVVAYLADHYTEEVSVEDAARIAHLSPSQFSRVFKRAMGRSFKRFLDALRVHVAAALLVEMPYQQITDIALRTGPWELGTFERAFKRHLRCPPSRYRDLGRADRQAGEPPLGS